MLLCGLGWVKRGESGKIQHGALRMPLGLLGLAQSQAGMGGPTRCCAQIEGPAVPYIPTDDSSGAYASTGSGRRARVAWPRIWFHAALHEGSTEVVDSMQEGCEQAAQTAGTEDDQRPAVAAVSKGTEVYVSRATKTVLPGCCCLGQGAGGCFASQPRSCVDGEGHGQQPWRKGGGTNQVTSQGTPRTVQRQTCQEQGQGRPSAPSGQFPATLLPPHVGTQYASPLPAAVDPYMPSPAHQHSVPGPHSISLPPPRSASRPEQRLCQRSFQVGQADCQFGGIALAAGRIGKAVKAAREARSASGGSACPVGRSHSGACPYGEASRGPYYTPRRRRRGCNLESGGSRLPRAWEDGVTTPGRTCFDCGPPIGVRHASAWCTCADPVSCSCEGTLGVGFATCGIGCITPVPLAWIRAVSRRACAAKCSRPPLILSTLLCCLMPDDSSRSDLPDRMHHITCLPLNLCAARPFWCGPKPYSHSDRPAVHVCASWPALMMPCRDFGLSSVSTRHRDDSGPNACDREPARPVVPQGPAVPHLLCTLPQPVDSVSLSSATGDTDAKGLVPRDREESIAGAFETAVRSFLLLQLFAFVHLLLRAVPMKKQAGSTNCVIRGSHAVFRGAPLALVLALCLTLAGAAPDPPSQRFEVGTSPMNTVGAQGSCGS